MYIEEEYFTTKRGVKRKQATSFTAQALVTPIASGSSPPRKRVRDNEDAIPDDVLDEGPGYIVEDQPEIIAEKKRKPTKVRHLLQMGVWPSLPAT